tara:strand:- start:518 stop:1003 length:486 start_codon:yes stop_codon:yes gene_type:complete
MAISSVVKNFRDGTLTIEDGTGTPLDVVVQYEAGDFSLSGLTAGQKEVTTYMDRGDLCSVRQTSQTFPSLSFSAHLSDLSDASEETLPDILLKQGSKSSAVSTLGATADVYTVKLTWSIAEPGGAAHTVVLDDVYCSLDMSEGDPSSFSISGTVYGSIVMT